MSTDKESDDKPYILNLDDDPDFNNILRVVLKKEGFKLVSTKTPEEFAAKIKEKLPVLCLIDINLDIGQGAGLTLVQAIRNKYGQSLPILIISRKADRETISRALELGADDLIPKPLDDTLLIQKINLYHRQSHIPPLPYFKVSEKDWPLEFTYDLNICEVNEFGVTFKSPHFLGKGTYLEVQGEFIEKLTRTTHPLKITVNRSWKEENEDQYRAFCEFDYTDIDLKSAVRSFILSFES
jgi:CheY-like chemotaxis protein